MIKLKSLFRRQGPSGSSKQSSNPNSSMRGAASTSSLNSVGLSTASSSSTVTATTTSKPAEDSKPYLRHHQISSRTQFSNQTRKSKHRDSNDHLESAFRESNESLDAKNSSSPKLYSTSSGGESTSGFISSLGNTKSLSTHVIGSSPALTSSSPTTKSRKRVDQHLQDKFISTTATSTDNPSASPIVGKSLNSDLKDSDIDIGPDDGCISCYSSSIRDLLSDELPEDCTFNGPDDIQQHQIILELQENLERMTRDKMALESKIVEASAYKSEMGALKCEIAKLQTNYERAIKESHQLIEENESLRNRLRDVVNSPLSDAEKQQIIEDSQQRLHNSAPPSIALTNIDGETSSCITTPDWDKHSSSSEVSVACLQDKIIQMEETHYSTNEELQATLQELADLQSQLTELQVDNDRLIEEKEVLFQSLCRQTEKLEDSRNKIRELLLRDSDQQDAVMTTEREQKLLDLLKNAQDERESMFIKHDDLQSDIKNMRSALEMATNEKLRIIERIGLLESALDASAAERKQIDAELLKARDESNQHQIEISRLTTLLENARSKIDELDQERAIGERSDLSDLLDMARKEKDMLESDMTILQESLSKSQCEVQKLKNQIAAITEECKVTRNNAKCALSDLEYKFDRLKQDKAKLSYDLQLAKENLNELQIQCKSHLEDKAHLEKLLSETQQNLSETKQLLSEKDDALNNERKLRKFEKEEWKQFQSDLLMTVRVANDFKTEAQIAHEQLIVDNKTQKERIRALEQENMRLSKAMVVQDSQASLLSSVMQQEMAQRRQRVGISRQDSRLSVKSLIESIEKSSHVKSNGQTGDTHSSSSSINSLMSDAARGSIGEWNDGNSLIVDQSKLHASLVRSRSPLNEKQTPSFCDGSHNNNISNNTTTKVNSGTTIESSLQQQALGTTNNIDTSQKLFGFTGERKDPLSALVKNGGSKRNALLKWCQNKTVGYRNIDITNFSSSWNDGLAFCAILHSYLKDKIPYDTLGPNDKRRNFTIAFHAAESVGIHTTLNISNMCQQERPDWQQVLAYVTAIYKHFET